MKSLIPLVIVVALSAGLLGVTAPKPTDPKPAAPVDLSQSEKVSYIIGFNIGRGLANDSIEISKEQFLEGLTKALAKQPSKISPDDRQATMKAFSKQMKAKQKADSEKAGATAKGEGEAFLESNKDKPGITRTSSGLQYKILRSGSGKTPTAADKVTTHYRGTLINGEEFDSSYKRGQQATFAVNGVIAGWTEALQLMKEGDKWQLFIPTGLAYGKRPPTTKIPPNSALIFELELIKVGE